MLMKAGIYVKTLVSFPIFYLDPSIWFSSHLEQILLLFFVSRQVEAIVNMRLARQRTKVIVIVYLAKRESTKVFWQNL